MAEVPRIPVPDVANIPQEMRGADRWCSWKYDRKKDGKLTKVPIDPHTGGLGSSTNSRTWGTLEDVMRYVRQSHEKRGIGFVLGDGWCGIDLDHVVHGHGFLRFAAEILDYFSGTYLEYSPSGTGVHIYFVGDDPGPRPGQNTSRQSVGKAGTELYGAGRFFTVTAKPVYGGREPAIGTYEAEDFRWFRDHVDNSRARARSIDGRVKTSSHAGDNLTGEDLADVDIDSENQPPPLKFAEVMRRTKFRNHWEQKSSPKGAKENGNSERALGMANICARAGWTAQEVCDLIQYWCAETGQELYHRSKMEHTLSKAFNHTSTVEDAPVDLTDTIALQLKVADRLGLIVQSLVQVGKDDAHYELTLVSGAVRQIETNKLFRTKDTWDEIASTEAVAQGTPTRKNLTAKEWPDVLQWLFGLCTYQEAHETDPAEETRFWVETCMDGVKSYDVEESVGLHDWQSGRFRIGRLSYLGLESILTHVRNLGSAQTMPQMTKRFRTVGFHNATVYWQSTGESKRLWTDDPRTTLRVGKCT